MCEKIIKGLQLNEKWKINEGQLNVLNDSSFIRNYAILK
jgi:hypothetical protein